MTRLASSPPPAELDTAILVGGAADGNANFERATVDARVATDATDDELRALQAETERRRPVLGRRGNAVTAALLRVV